MNDDTLRLANKLSQKMRAIKNIIEYWGSIVEEFEGKISLDTRVTVSDLVLADLNEQLDQVNSEFRDL